MCSFVKVCIGRETEHRSGLQIMVGAESFRPCVVSALGHFGLIWIVISFLLFINLYHYGRVEQRECVRVVRGGFR